MVRLPLSSSLAFVLLALAAPRIATATASATASATATATASTPADTPNIASPDIAGPEIAGTRTPSPAAQLPAPVRGAVTTPTTTPNRTAKASRPVAPPRLGWHARVAIAIEKLQTEAPQLITKLGALQPSRSSAGDLIFTQPELHDPRAAPLLLQRLLAGADPVDVRCAIVDALPLTGGDWQEGAAALIAVDSSPRVRKQLVEIMRYAGPDSVHGLRLGFKDEDPEINIAAARTAGFSRQGAVLLPELYSSTFDADWDLRAAAVQALGMLKLPQSRDVLVKALADESRDVRLQALLALEQLDPDGLLELPELEQLSRDRKSHRIARKATQLLRKRKLATRRGSVPTPAPALLAVPGAR